MRKIGGKVLCVDDSANILDGLRRQLRRKFDVTTAPSGEAGLQILRSQGPFAVVLSDYKMPGMNGVEFLREAHRLAPYAVTLMLSGHADLDAAASALHEGHIFRFLQKPCPRELLVKTIADCLEQYRLVMSEQILTAELNRANDELRALNESLGKRVGERTATIRRLYRFVSELNGLDNLEDVAELVVSTTAELLNSRRVSLMLPDAGRRHLIIKAATGINDQAKAQVRVPIGTSIAGRVFAESQNIVVNDPHQLPNDQEQHRSDSVTAVPLMSACLVTPGGPVGVLNVTEQIDGVGYDQESIAGLKAIAEAAAIAIRNQIRLEERNEARDAVILALAKLAEHRDRETGAHLERVQAYCRLLSEALAETPKYASVIDAAFIETIVRSSPLHDVGKVGVPDRILLKPGPLTPEEFDLMKRHAVTGGDTVRALLEQGRTQGFLKMGMEIAYWHHERFDGSGYPHGLAGEEIPLPARIMALADVYDALTSKRVYKSAMSHEKAASIIRAESGSHFDPDLVEAFFKREKEFETLVVELADAAELPSDDAGARIERDSLPLIAE